MADFNRAFEKMIRNEGGYRLHRVQGDRGGMTYAGIARNFHPDWPGWNLIDNNETDSPELTPHVKTFYRKNFWDRIKGEDIKEQSIAETLFDFSVNAGHKTAVKLAQLILDTTPDGIIGDITLGELNKMQGEEFNLRYALAKVARYAQIVNKDKSQSKFLLGWINRTLKGVA